MKQQFLRHGTSDNERWKANVVVVFAPCFEGVSRPWQGTRVESAELLELRGQG